MSEALARFSVPYCDSLGNYRNCRHRPMRQSQARAIYQSAQDSRCQVREIGVADDRMNADGGDKTRCAGQGQGLPKIARGPTAPNAENDQHAAGAHAAAEPRPIVRDKRYEPGIDLL